MIKKNFPLYEIKIKMDIKPGIWLVEGLVQAEWA